MASKGQDVSDGVPTSLITSKREAKISGPNSSRGAAVAEKPVNHHEGCNHGRKLGAQREEQASKVFVEPPAPRAPAKKERLEDVFQEEIVQRFGKMTDFKKFARSQYGLCLREYDIESIIEDNASAEEAKIQMLSLWRQRKGKKATPQLIRDVVEEYMETLN